MRASLFVPLFVPFILLAACGEIPKAGTQDKAPLHAFWRTQPDYEIVEQDLEPGAQIKLINKETGMPRLIEREPSRLRSKTEDLGLENADLISIAEQAVHEMFPEAEFELSDIDRGFTFDYVSFKQTHKGYPIIGAELTLRITKGGDWVASTSNVYDPKNLPSFNFKSRPINLPASILAGSEIISERSVIYPRKENNQFKFYPAHEFQISNTFQRTGFILWIHEETGETLGAFNPGHGAGEKQFYGGIVPNQIGDKELLVPFPSVELEINSIPHWADFLGRFNFTEFLGLEAFVRLQNPYIKVVNNRGRDNGGIIKITEDFLNEGPHILLDDASSLEERNIYFWIMKAREYLETELNYYKMDYQILAMARDGIKLDQAYFNPIFRIAGQPVLGFGEGYTVFYNTALSRDIILHEYGHAVTVEIYGLKNTYEFMAMNEAFSDYFAAAITNDPLIAEGMLLDPKREYLRRLDNEMIYPKDFKGTSFHEDGQMFSGALWQLRQNLGAKLADQMIHEARLSKAATIVEFYAALLMLDKAMSDDTSEWTTSPRRALIRAAFRKHGLNSQTKFIPPAQEILTLPWSSCWKD